VQVCLLLVVVGVHLVRADHHLRCHVVQRAHTGDGALLGDVNGETKVCSCGEAAGSRQAARKGVAEW
jgi:hypothetical protein